MDSNSWSPGICQRLISFILRTMRRPSAVPGSTQVEEGSSRKPNNRSNGFVDSEIVIEFRHTDGSESRSQTNERWNSTHARNNDGLKVSNDQTTLQNDVDGKEGNKDHFGRRINPKTVIESKGKQLRELEALSGRDDRGKGLKKTVTMKKSEGKKEVNQSADQAMMSNQPHDEKKSRPPRQHWPLLSVASNINEKSDAYISSRKKPWRNYSLDPEKS